MAEIPSIKQLFSESWQIFKKSALQLLILGVLWFLVAIVHLIITVVGLGILGFGLSKLSIAPTETMANLIKLGWPLFAYLAVMTIIGVALSTLFQAASIAAVNATGEDRSLGKALKVGLKSILPLWLTGILLVFVLIGNYVILVLPGIIVSIFLTFVPYEVVIARKNLFSAIRGSVQMMSQFFGEVIVRVLLFWIVYIVILVLIPNLLMRIDPVTYIYAVFILMFVSVLLGWYTLAYFVTLYKHVAKNTDFDKKSPLWWLWLGTFIGWMIIVAGGYFGVKAIKKLPWKQWMEQASTTNNVGKSMKNSLESMDPEAKTHWDKSQELFKQMRENSTNAQKVVSLNDENISELKAALEIEPENPLIWVGLGDAYTWISSSGDLEDGLTAYKKAFELEPTNVVYSNYVGDMLIRLGKDEEAILQFQKSLRLYEKSGYAHKSMGFAYMRLGINDTAKEHLERAVAIFEEENTKGNYDNDILDTQKLLGELDK